MSTDPTKQTTAELIVMFFDAWGDRYSELRDHAVIGPVFKRAHEAYETLKSRHDFTTSSRLAREQAVAEILNAAK